MKRFLLVGLLTLLPTLASAQCNGVFPNNTVCGNVTGAANTPRATNPSAFLGAAGGTNGQIQYNNGGALAGFTASGDILINTLTGVATIQPNAVDTTEINNSAVSSPKIATGAVTSAKLAANAIPVFATRTAAAALDLSAFTAIRTIDYATAGDGGGASFYKLPLTTTPFIDSYITTFSIQGGSGYTNGGPYYGNLFSITGKPFAVGTVTVAGGAFTAVNIQYTPGNKCAVGDVLPFVGSAAATAAPANGLPAGGTGASITVTGCSTPLASFTDSAGNRWQYVPNGFINVKQFGAKGDWDGTDGTATDDFNAIQSASWFAGYKTNTSFDGGGFWGGKVIFPSGSYMAGCSGTKPLIVAQSVIFEGPSEIGAQIKLCNTFDATTHFIEICDPTWHFACFGSKLKNISLFADRNFGVSAGTVMVHTNSVQDFGGLDTVYIYAGQRGCTHFEEGFGGASTALMQNVSCNGASTNTVMMRFGNTVASGLAYGTTIFEIKNLVLGGPSSCSPTCQTAAGLIIQGGGFFDIAGVHCENAGENCITVDIPATGNGDLVRLHNINAGWGAPATACTGIIFLTAANTPGNTMIGMVPAGSCTNVVLNGQPSGANRTTGIGLDMIFNP